MNVDGWQCSGLYFHESGKGKQSKFPFCIDECSYGGNMKLSFQYTLTCLAISIFMIATVSQAQQTRTQDSGIYTAQKTGHQTKTNNCDDAKCVSLSVSVPLGSQIVAIRCYANIRLDGGADLPHNQFNEIPCGQDVSWSIFDRPVTQTSQQAITVSTTYHNRSDNRDRDVKLVVEFRL
jgi:hypothetical protein